MSEAAAPLKLSFTIPEVCKATGIGRSALYEEIKAGNLRSKKRGSQTLILATDLEAFLAGLPDGGKGTVQ